MATNRQHIDDTLATNCQPAGNIMTTNKIFSRYIGNKLKVVRKQIENKEVIQQIGNM